ncbi:PH domain-containing protein [Alkalicoccobacillus plakortidis]|uniref:PH domain-containing protein n=1 Tax=Alkalicoccobacillus plakortidis TaxID=444060 RepID=A0ABT0XMS1_9BACI|nr:PH domain-containing protein [Alkalicoccobacillus plakortidis]MCM2677208.1 PH domain-containing protein [Alkalicoccobacillus plakortidis]
MEQGITLPDQRISKKAVVVWRISSTIAHVITLLVLGTVLFLHWYYDWANWIGYITYVITGLIILQAIYKIFIYPIYMQKTWRYRVDNEYIQIKHGAIEHVHLLIPMVKVLHVSTSQGPILRKFGLSTITIGTTASSHEIPALPVDEAEDLREKIAMLAKVTEDE